MSFTGSRTLSCPVCRGTHGADESCATLARGADSRPGTSGARHPTADLSAPAYPGSSSMLEGPDPLIGTTFGSFKLVRRLGKGGMGSVYLGEHTVIGSKVAVKLLHPHLATNADLVSRFYAEARAVNLIGDENIVSIFDMNVVPPNQYYLVMEYLEGTSLAAICDRPMSPKVSLPILVQACDALEAAHAHGVIHRDLKPENIFLIKRGRTENFVKLLDFGIAKLFAHNGGGHTGAGTLVGTPEYMSPEQCNGLPVDGRSDIYALGIIAYRLVTGRLPFTEGGLTGILIAHVQKVPPAPHELSPEIPRELSDVIMRAIAKAPEARFQTPAALRSALERVLESLDQRVAVTPVVPSPQPSTPAVPFSPPPSPPKPVRRWPARVRVGTSGLPSEVQLADLSRAAAFVCTDAAPPALLQRVQLSLQVDGKWVESSAQVVSHVSETQARGWGMSAGYAVQFVESAPAFKDGIARALQSEGSRPPAPAFSAAPATDDPVAERILEPFKRRSNVDHYQVLNVARDLDLDELRSRGRELRRNLEALRQRRLSARQEEHVTEALGRVAIALDTLGTPARRAEYDAQLNNFRGVARCIAAGLTVTEIESLRKKYLAQRPAVETQSTIHGRTAAAWESSGELDRACEEYEKALNVDPLNLGMQQRYWRLKRRPAGSRAL